MFFLISGIVSAIFRGKSRALPLCEVQISLVPVVIPQTLDSTTRGNV